MAKGKYHKWLTEEGLIRLEGWARMGLTNEQIAHNIGINKDTLYDWMNRFPDISDALKRGKEVVDFQVENALLKRALGGKYEETRIEIMPNGKKKAIQTTRDVPPDTGAAIFWLKNRMPDFWRDKPVSDVEDVFEDDGLIEALNASCSIKPDFDLVEQEGE